MRAAPVLFALGVVVAAAAALAACSSTKDDAPAVSEDADAHADDDATVSPTIDAAATSDATDATFACPSDVTKLTTLLMQSACGICTLDKCTMFKADCTADCKCTDALLELLTCVTIGSDVQACQAAAVGALSSAQLNEYIVCNGLCGAPCSDKTFFVDGGDDASDVADGEVPDASEPGDASDAGDAAN